MAKVFLGIVFNCFSPEAAGVSPRTVIDLGANVGQLAVAAANLFDGAKILSIEPDPRTAGMLKKNLKAIKQAEVFVVAVGDSVGEAEFYVNKEAQALHQRNMESLRKELIMEGEAG